MTFGIWFEPEMINPEASDLHRAQPALGAGVSEDQTLGQAAKGAEHGAARGAGLSLRPDGRDPVSDHRDRLHQMGPQPRAACCPMRRRRAGPTP